MGWFSDIVGTLSGAGGVEDAARESAADTREAAARAEALNRERYGQAQGYMTPFIGRSDIASRQLMAELGLPQYASQNEDGSFNPYAGNEGEYTARDVSDIPGFQASVDQSVRSAEQSAVSSGSTAYGGRRLEAAGEAGAGVQQSYYNNYMNMLQNLESPETATNLSSMGMNQGIAMGAQDIGATNMANMYMMEGAGAMQAGYADMMGAMQNMSGINMMGGGGGGSGGGGDSGGGGGAMMGYI